MTDRPRPSLEEFTAEFEQALRAAGHVGPIVRDATQGRVEIHGERWMSVPHLYEQLAPLDPEQRRARLEQAAAMMVRPLALPPTWAETAPLLRLNAKPQMQLVSDELRRQAGAGPSQIYVATLTPHLTLELVVPQGGGNMSVPRETLDGWGVSPDDALAAAGENEAPRLREPWRTDAQRPGVYRSPWQDGRDGGRLLFRQVFAALPLHGRPVVMLPMPSVLLVAGSEDATGLKHLADFVLEEVKRTGRWSFLRALCGSADGTAWEDWLPPESHPAYRGFRTLQAMQEVRDASQHADRIAEVERFKGREAVALPRLELVLESRTHLPMTVTTWRSGKPVALPKADGIVLKRGAKLLGIVAWDDVVRTFPGTLTKLAGYPARFLAADFPEDWQLDMLEIQPWKPPREGPAR